MISDRLFNTFFLAGVTAIVSIPFALILGLFAALYRESWFDRIVNITTLTTISAPEFFIAYVLVLLLAGALSAGHRRVPAAAVAGQCLARYAAS
jgi:peptide/nickel transport system permease protein